MKKDKEAPLISPENMMKYGFPLRPPQTEAEWEQYDEAMARWVGATIKPNEPAPKFKEVFFGSIIRAKREEKGWRLKDAAERYGIGAPYLSDIEKRKQKPPSRQTVIRIGKALGMTLRDIGYLCLTAETEQTGLGKDKVAFMRKYPYVAMIVGSLIGLEEDMELEGKPAEHIKELIERIALSAVLAIADAKKEECPNLYSDEE